ncbi:MAG: hypothetical protein HYW49_10175 [Deltaproteobacteria bacterium]|nr:hypothetical protein [Deltaproteobacteria bacterium]
MKTLKTLILTTVLGSSLTAFAQQAPQQVPLITPPAGFSEGTETKLTDVQIVDLVPWAKNSKRDLEELLLDADTIGSPVVKKRTLLAGIQNLVISSQPLKSELLMRYVLNRALVVNTEIENEAIAQNSGKAPIGIVDQQIRLLTLSAKMAVKYFESDLAFLNGAVTKKDVNLVTLPYASFGLEYAEFLMNLNNSITDASAQYNIGVIALGLLQWDLYRDQNKVAFADSITKINSFLKTIPERANGQDDNQSAVYVRQIKRRFQSVTESIRQRLTALDPASTQTQTSKQTQTNTQTQASTQTPPVQNNSLDQNTFVDNRKGGVEVTRPKINGKRIHPNSDADAVCQALGFANSDASQPPTSEDTHAYGIVVYRNGSIAADGNGYKILGITCFRKTTKVIKNPDGSTTLKNPVLQIGEADEWISVTSNADGVCKAFHLNTAIKGSMLSIEMNSPTISVIDSLGQFAGYAQKNEKAVIVAITCN